MNQKASSLHLWTIKPMHICFLPQWDAFSIPELRNFLLILDKEEQEQKDALIRRYTLYRKRLEEAIRQHRVQPLRKRTAAPCGVGGGAVQSVSVGEEEVPGRWDETEERRRTDEQNRRMFRQRLTPLCQTDPSSLFIPLFFSTLSCCRLIYALLLVPSSLIL